MPDRRGSEPARYEDSLRARHWMSMTLANQEPRRFVAISEEERGALADAVEALRDYIGPEPLKMLRRRDAGETLIGATARAKWVRLVEALARLDGLGESKEPGVNQGEFSA